MRIGILGTCVLLLGSSPAFAGDPPDVTIEMLVQSLAIDGTAPAGTHPMRFAFDRDATDEAPGPYHEPEGATGRLELKKPIVAWSGDKHTGWIAVDGLEYGYCGEESCGKDPPIATHHIAIVFDDAGQPIVWHDVVAVPDKDQAKALAKGVTLAPMGEKIEPGAEDAVKLFTGSIGDAKALAATVSARKDVVLFGSAPAERFVGGAAVKAQLAKWNLVMTVRDHVHAGVASNGNVAWVAAKVDAKPAKNAKAKPSPYRALFVYEKTGGAWQLVQASFSFLAAEP
jgi:hypothetical protein